MKSSLLGSFFLASVLMSQLAHAKDVCFDFPGYTDKLKLTVNLKSKVRQPVVGIWTIGSAGETRNLLSGSAEPKEAGNNETLIALIAIKNNINAIGSEGTRSQELLLTVDPSKLKVMDQPVGAWYHGVYGGALNVTACPK